MLAFNLCTSPTTKNKINKTAHRQKGENKPEYT